MLRLVTKKTPEVFRRARLGKPGSGIWRSSATPHCLAGLREVPAEVPALVLAPGREFLLPPRPSVSRV